MKLRSRIAITRILNRVSEGRWANELLQHTLAEEDWSDRDRGFITEMVSGVLRYRGRLDFVLAQFSHTPLSDLDMPVLNILRLGSYQLLFTRVPDYAALDAAVRVSKTLKLHRASGFINGVLRHLSREQSRIEYPDLAADPVQYISVMESHPRWMVELWVKRWGVEETLALCRANNQPAPPILRVNQLQTDPTSLTSAFESQGRSVRRSVWAPHGLVLQGGHPIVEPWFAAGHYSIQSEASQLGVLATGVQRNMTILDACAGRGGKSLYLAELMQDQGEIHAMDIEASKLRYLIQEQDRLGLRCIHTSVGDARAPIDGSYDLVLVDAPCSGLGIIGREADARWHKSPDLMERMPELQFELLTASAASVRLGGILQYCTCSIMEEENDHVVSRFLQAHPEFSLSSSLNEADRSDALHIAPRMQLWPHHHGTDGFFWARLRRVAQ